LDSITIPPSMSAGDSWPTGTLLSDGTEASAPTSDVVLQSLSISPKGEVQATYSDNKTYTLRFVAIANFPSDQGLKAIGNNRYSETGLSGAASITGAGAPKAGNIMTGTLEQANVDITTELMDMIRSQQVYNGNARMLQTTMETVSRITDKI
jgi:flagellar hook protein FlgE